MPVDPPTGANVGTGVVSSTSSQSAPVDSNSVPLDILADVEREQVVADLQASLASCQSRLDQLQKENEAVTVARDGAVSTVNQLRTQLTSLQSTHLQSSSELSVIQSRMEATEREKRELLEEIERLQARSTQATQEVYTLRTQRVAASQKISQLEVDVSTHLMTANSAKFNEDRSLKALEGSRNEIRLLTKAVADVDARFSAYRAQAQSDISQLQLENDTAQTRATSTQSSYQSLKRTFEAQSQRLADAQATIATLTTAAASQKASYRLEFDRLREEIRISVKQGDEARAAVADRELELERAAEREAEREREAEERLNREIKARKNAEQQAEDLKNVVDVIAGQESNDGISPTASLLARQNQEGKSYTQLYTDLAIQKSKLQSADVENIRLTALLNEVQADIERSRPVLDEQAAEYRQALERANALASELASVQTTRDQLQSQVKTLEAATAHHNEEVTSLQSTTEDLALQVRSLTREIAIRDDPSLAHASINGSADSGTGNPITDQFVAFKSLNGLQHKNQQLLALTRGLEAKLNKLVSGDARSDDDASMALDQATETVERLHAQVVEQQQKVSELTRERDFFSKLLSRGEGLRWSSTAFNTSGPLEGGDDSREEALSTLQSELDHVRARAEADIAEAKEMAKQRSEAAGVAEVERVKAEARATMLEEQHRILAETHSLQQKQVSDLESQIMQLQGHVAQARAERREAMEQLAAHQSSETRLREEAALLRAEKEHWESVKTRSETDLATVQQDRARLLQSVESLQGINSEHQRTRDEDRAKLEKRIEELQREAVTLRAQVDQAREGARLAEQRLQETDTRIATETAQIRGEKEALEALVAGKTTEIEQLTQQVSDAKRIGLNWQRRSKELQQQVSDSTSSQSSAVAEKEAEVATLQGELEQTRQKIAELEKKVAEAESASQLHQSTVQRLQSELAAAKTQQSTPAAVAPAAPPAVDPADLTTLQSERDALKTERDSLQERLAQAEKDLETAKAAKVAEPSTDPATAVAAAPGGADTTLQAELDAVTKKLSDKETQYDNDVIKVNRVNAGLNNRVKAFNAEKAELEGRIAELEQEVADLKTKLEAAKAGSTPDAAAAAEAATKAAVSKREAELKQEHEAALAKASDPGAVQTAVSSREAELRKEFETQLAEAKSSASSAGDNAELVADYEAKIKKLERQIKNAEIKYKTFMARQNGPPSSSTPAPASPAPEVPAATPAAAATPATTSTTPAATTATPVSSAAPLSAAAPPFQPPAKSPLPAKPAPAPATAAAATVVAPSTTPSPAPGTEATTTALARGGATVRGRGRGTAVRGRGGAAAGRPNSVLSAVNATLAATTESGTKRPAPDDDAVPAGTGIIARLQQTATEGAAASPAAPGRAAKRPRGGGAARGRGTARRASGGGGTGTGGGEGA